MKNKILITGVTGFVGKNLLCYLKSLEKYHITGVIRDLNKIDKKKLQIDELITYEELFKNEISCVNS